MLITPCATAQQAAAALCRLKTTAAGNWLWICVWGCPLRRTRVVPQSPVPFQWVKQGATSSTRRARRPASGAVPLGALCYPATSFYFSSHTSSAS